MLKAPQKLQFELAPFSLKQASIFLVDGLGHKQNNFRWLLRQLASECLMDAGFGIPNGVDNVHVPFSHSSQHVSLSHTVGASAFGWIEGPKSLGLDIELLERITHPVVERVSARIECETAPDLRFLWPAKEAVFKAISPQCRVLSEIQIRSWASLDPLTWTYKASLASSDQTIDGSGLVCLVSKHLLSFFVLQY